MESRERGVMDNDHRLTTVIQLPERLDSDNAETVQKGILEKIEQAPRNEIILDAEALNYVSSAGLRVVLFLVKNHTVREMINVSAAVFDILETTGFCRIMKIRKRLRQIQIEGLEEIGRGFSGQVYRLGKDELIKVFTKDWTFEMAEKERDTSRELFVLGIETAIAYDIVKVGERFGVVYEMIKADSLSNVFTRSAADEQKVRELAGGYAEFVKKMHQVTIHSGFESMKQQMIQEVASTGYISEEHKQTLMKELEQIPETDTFVHGDFHPGNVMYKEGQFILIDLGTAAIGAPALDLAWIYILIMKYNSLEGGPRNKSTGLGKLVWNTFIRTYYGTEDEDRIAALERALTVLGVVRQTSFIHTMPELARSYVAQKNDGMLRECLTEGVLKPLFADL